MPTRAGWQLLLFSVAAFVTGRAFGILELYVVGATTAAAAITALAVRALRVSRLEVRRTLSSPLVGVGEQADVTLRIANRSEGRSPLVVLRDRIAEEATDSDREVRLYLAPMSGRSYFRRQPHATDSKRIEARYSLETARRGVVHVGPLRIEDHDALGLARRWRHLDLRDRLVVHPPIESLMSSPVSADGDPMSAELRRWALDRAPADFDGMREYVTGDDPRRIHWPTTARLDQLMVRQFRSPPKGRLTIIIDTRPPGDLRAPQDCTTSVAVSIAAAVLEAGDEAQIVTSDGSSTSILTGLADMPAALEFCALLSGGSDQIAQGLASHGCVALAVTASPLAASDETSRLGLARHLGASMVVTCDVERWGTDTAVSAAGSVSGWIHLTGPGQLSQFWPPTGLNRSSSNISQKTSRT